MIVATELALVAQARESLNATEVAWWQACRRFEELFASYDDGTFCIGKDAYWPWDLAAAERDILAHAEYRREARDIYAAAARAAKAEG